MYGDSDRWKLAVTFLSHMIQEDEAEKENCIVQLPKAIDQSEVSPILLCQSDQPPLWIGFGCVQVGSTTVRQFTLVNPQKSAVEISATFNYNQNGITLAIGEPDNRTVILFPGKRIEATISWNPQRNYSLCDTIQIILQNGVILSISVHGLSGIGVSSMRLTCSHSIARNRRNLCVEGS